MTDQEGVRLQRVLAAAGLGSRRACEQLIEEGRVQVDGATVRVQGMRVDPDTAVISVDGLRIASAPDHTYLAVNKPRGVVSTMSDPEGRPSLAEYVEGRSARLFNVGRLDVDTEGLILLMNDGDLAHRLAHPSFGVLKTYLAEVTGPVARDVGKRLREGVELDDGPTAPARVALVPPNALRLVIHEGRNRQVRRMCSTVGHPVTRLVRIRIGPLADRSLGPGEWRALTADEVRALETAVAQK